MEARSELLGVSDDVTTWSIRYLTSPILKLLRLVHHTQLISVGFLRQNKVMFFMDVLGCGEFFVGFEGDGQFDFTLHALYG